MSESNDLSNTSSRVVALRVREWFVFQGWRQARLTVIGLVADFFVAATLWALYAAFSSLVSLLITDKTILLIVEATHSCSAVVAFALLGGLGLADIVRRTGGHSPR